MPVMLDGSIKKTESAVRWFDYPFSDSIAVLLTESSAARLPLLHHLPAIWTGYHCQHSPAKHFPISLQQPITETTFKRMWERIGKRIDLCGATPHVFRHTYITLAASSGMDVKTLQSIAGHSDIKMTLERYAHERENNVIAAGNLIGGVFRSM